MGANHLVVFLSRRRRPEPPLPTPPPLPTAVPRSSSSSSAPWCGGARAIRPSPTTGPGSTTGSPSQSAAGAGRGCRPRRSRSRWPTSSGSAPTTCGWTSSGRRSRSRSETLQLSSVWDRPWFVPRSVDDSVRIFSDEFPATGALHPLAPTGPEWYRYTLDQRALRHVGRDGALRLLGSTSRPGRGGPSLIAGQMWIDSTTAEVVRLTFRYVGTGSLGEAGQRHEVRLLLRATDQLHRQPGREHRRRPGVRAPGRPPLDAAPPGDLGPGADPAGERPGDSVPRRDDVRGLSRSTPAGPIAFALPLPETVDREARRDSLRAARRGGGRGEDSLRSWSYADRWSRRTLRAASAVRTTRSGRFDGWHGLPVARGRSRRGSTSRGKRSPSWHGWRRALPDSLTGRDAHGLGVRAAHRCAPLRPGAGPLHRSRVPGADAGLAFTDVYGTVRYGFSDERVTGPPHAGPRRAGRPPQRERISGRGERGPVRSGAWVRQHAERALRGPRRRRLRPGCGAPRRGTRRRSAPGSSCRSGRATSGRPA